ncbi:MAG TPA: hypothetical protein VES97_05620, partial [Solirubrobacteraceae bacterium]|nr:hypothetical protein [Solirubrobacteraceae bacterium]
MARSNRHPRTRRDWRAAVLLVATCLALSMTVAAAPAASASAAPRATAGRLPQPVATTTRTLAHALSAAAGRARLAKRVLASRTRALKRCLREHRGHPVRCGAARRALRLAARRLAYARRRVSRIARAAGRARHAAAARPVSAAASPGAFEMGAVVGSAELYELPWLQALGARTARMEFAIDDPVSQLEPVVEAYARAGIRPLLLAGFQARIPSTAEARNLASWATAFGPGGTFWRGRNLPASTAVTSIEFGNETNNPYQFSETSEDWFDQPAFI